MKRKFLHKFFDKGEVPAVILRKVRALDTIPMANSKSTIKHILSYNVLGFVIKKVNVILFSDVFGMYLNLEFITNKKYR